MTLFVALTPGVPSAADRRLHYDGKASPPTLQALPFGEVKDDYTRFVLRPQGSVVDPKKPKPPVDPEKPELPAYSIQCVADGHFMRSRSVGEAIDGWKCVQDNKCRYRFHEVDLKVAGEAEGLVYYYIEAVGTNSYLYYTGGDGLQPNAERWSLFYLRVEPVPPHQHFVPTDHPCNIVSLGNGRRLHFDGRGSMTLDCPESRPRDVYTEWVIVERVKKQGSDGPWYTIQSQGRDKDNAQPFLKVMDSGVIGGTSEVDDASLFYFIESPRRPGYFHILEKGNEHPIHANHSSTVDMPYTLTQLDDNFLLFKIQYDFFDNWVGGLNGSLKLIDTTIPGSHDSSSYLSADGMGTLATIVGAITQSGDYLSQLRGGIRYFDVRPTVHGDKVWLRHGFVLGELFSEVLDKQIAPFLEAHPKELVFLDIQLHPIPKPGWPILGMILEVLEQCIIPQKKFATEHLDERGHFKPSVTWADLRKCERQVIVTWNVSREVARSVEMKLPPWLSNSAYLRWSPYDHFDQKTLPQIIDCLDCYVANWKVEYSNLMFVAQVIDTPGDGHGSKPPSPLEPPSVYEFFHGAELNRWVLDKLRDSYPNGSPKLNVILRDFVNNYPGLISAIILRNEMGE